MSMGNVGGVGQDTSARNVPPTPCQPTVVERICNLENRANDASQQLARAEQVYHKLIEEVQQYREQLGLQPLPPDHFFS